MCSHVQAKPAAMSLSLCECVCLRARAIELGTVQVCTRFFFRHVKISIFVFCNSSPRWQQRCCLFLSCLLLLVSFFFAFLLFAVLKLWHTLLWGEAGGGLGRDPPRRRVHPSPPGLSRVVGIGG